MQPGKGNPAATLTSLFWFFSCALFVILCGRGQVGRWLPVRHTSGDIGKMSSEFTNFQFDSPAEGEADLDHALARWPACHSVPGSTEEAPEVKYNLIPTPEQEEEDEPTIVSGICTALMQKGAALKEEIEEMRALEQTCVSTLAMLRREQAMWHGKLNMARANIASAKKQREEAKLLLELHTTLQSSGVQEQNVKTMQKLLMQQLPKDIQRMVGDCLNSENGLDVPACIVCRTEFTDASLWSPETNRRCRHTLFPCNHAVVCGGCARELWANNQVCPLCNTLMTKKPKMFKPGRSISEE